MGREGSADVRVGGPLWLGAACLLVLAADPASAQTAAPVSAQTATSTPPAASQIEGVTVTAQRPQVQTLPDRTVYSLGQELQAITGSAADVMSQLPAIEVDIDGNLSLRGDPNVVILVDGKPSAQFAGAAAGLALQQFPASQIDRIEVMTHPPAQYAASGSGGVINIVTKKTRRAGLSGTLQGSWGDEGRSLVGASAAYGAGPLNLSAGVVLRRDVKVRQVTEARAETDPATGQTAASTETLNETLRRFTPLFKLGFEDKLDRFTSLGASASHQELTGHRWFDEQDATREPTTAPVSTSERRSDGHEWNKVTDEEIHLDRALGPGGQALALSASRSVERERERYAYLNLFDTPPASPTRDDLHLSHDLVTNDLKADLTLPAGKSLVWRAGYEFVGDIDYFDTQADTLDPVTLAPTLEPGQTDHFRYSQHVHALYGALQDAIGPWRLDAGLRVERADMAFRPGLTGPFTHAANQGLYPSLHLERDLTTKSRWTLALSRRINRPDPEALDPFLDTQDIRNPRSGNPDLKPEDILSADTGYGLDGRAVSFTLDGFYRFSRNAVTDVSEVIGANEVLTTKANLPKTRSGGVELTAHGPIGPLSYVLDATFFYSQIDARALGATGLQSTTGLNAKLSLTYKATRRDTLQLAVSRSDKRLTPQGYVGAIDLVNLGYRRALDDRLSFVVTVSDALNGQVFVRTTNAPGLAQTYRRRQSGDVVLGGLVYTFGASGKTKKPDFDYDKP